MKHVGGLEWEVLKQVMLSFGDVAPFLRENELAPANRGKILAILDDQQKCSRLQVELAIVIDVGEHFVKAIYSLEGDGPLVFSCFEVLSTVNASIHAAHTPNTQAVIQRLSGTAGSTISSQQWLTYAKKCVESQALTTSRKSLLMSSVGVWLLSRQHNCSCFIKLMK